MKYILIITMLRLSNAGPAITAVEFESREACHSAAAVWIEDMRKNEQRRDVYPRPPLPGGVTWLCVPKG